MTWLAALGIAFGTIAVAELADKTQLVTISQACRYPYAPVLLGSALALILVTAIGVVAGTALHLVLPQEALGVIAGALFLAFGAFMVWRWHRDRMAKEVAVRGTDGAREVGPECAESNWRVLGSTFGLVAVAELGDKTQLAVVALSGEYGSPLAVLVGASAALVMVSAVGVLAGRVVARRLSMAHVELVAAALFIALGALFMLDAL